MSEGDYDEDCMDSVLQDILDSNRRVSMSSTTAPKIKKPKKQDRYSTGSLGKDPTSKQDRYSTGSLGKDPKSKPGQLGYTVDRFDPAKEIREGIVENRLQKLKRRISGMLAPDSDSDAEEAIRKNDTDFNIQIPEEGEAHDVGVTLEGEFQPMNPELASSVSTPDPAYAVVVFEKDDALAKLPEIPASPSSSNSEQALPKSQMPALNDDLIFKNPSQVSGFTGSKDLDLDSEMNKSVDFENDIPTIVAEEVVKEKSAPRWAKKPPRTPSPSPVLIDKKLTAFSDRDVIELESALKLNTSTEDEEPGKGVTGVPDSEVNKALEAIAQSSFDVEDVYNTTRSDRQGSVTTRSDRRGSMGSISSLPRPVEETITQGQSSEAGSVERKSSEEGSVERPYTRWGHAEDAVCPRQEHICMLDACFEAL